MIVPPFVFLTTPQRVVFASGCLATLSEEAARLGVTRAMVVSTRSQRTLAERAADKLGPVCRALFTEAVMHTPVDTTERALALTMSADVNGIVAVGGGSTIGLSKALALRTDLPQIVTPTTYAGSEMTDRLGQTLDGVKTTLRDPRVRPEVVLYDVDLTLTLPPGVSITSGINAMAHAVEGLYAEDANPLMMLLAEEGIRVLAGSLTDVARRPSNKTARTQALYGAWLCGMVLNHTSTALHHRICHVLGGAFNLPHSETHTVVLPHVAAYNEPAAPEAMRAVARALGVIAAPEGLFDFAKHAGAPISLRELGMPEAGLDRAAELTMAEPCWNPRPFSQASVRILLEDAWRGTRPQ